MLNEKDKTLQPKIVYVCMNALLSRRVTKTQPQMKIWGGQNQDREKSFKTVITCCSMTTVLQRSIIIKGPEMYRF